MDDLGYAWMDLLDERQNKEMEFANIYAADFHHGTDGHNRLMLINLLMNILQSVELSGVDVKSIYSAKE